MSTASQFEPSRSSGGPWNAAARGSRRESLGRAVEACRQYLLMIAEAEIDPALRARGGASDIVQETMIIAERRLDHFRGSSERELRAWTRRILLHRLAHFHRQHRAAGKRRVGREVPLGLHERSAEHAAPVTSPSEDLLRDERLQALRRAVDALPDRSRQVFLMRHQEGCSHEEIGRRLGISADAARKHWARTIEHLQNDLGTLR